MPDSRARKYLIGTFDNADTLLRAIAPLRREHFRIFDVFSPYPIHGLDDVMGVKRTRLPWFTLGAGLLGMSLAISFQFYTNILDWPLNVGGKPDNSTLAFIPVSFELTVLFAGLCSVAVLFLRSRLFPGKREVLVAPGITDDTFALVLRTPPDQWDQARVRELLERSGARAVGEREVTL